MDILGQNFQNIFPEKVAFILVTQGNNLENVKK